LLTAVKFSELSLMYLSESSRWEVQARRQRNYDPLYMDLAVESVVTGKMNPTQAAREFRVPRQTIVNRLNRLKIRSQMCIKRLFNDNNTQDNTG